MTWRTIEEAHAQWCPHARIIDIREIDTAPPVGEIMPVAGSVNRLFDLPNPAPLDVVKLLLPPEGEEITRISCVADLCSQWEKSTEVIPEEQEPEGRCGLPTWTEHFQKRT